MKYQIFPDVLPPEIINEALLCTIPNHHGHGDDEGHGGEMKPNFFPMVAHHINERLGSNIPDNFWSVDPWSKIYHLDSSSKPVLPHRDKDFKTETGLIAKWSVLAYLTDDYTGGQTIFIMDEVCPHLTTGSVVIFPHGLLHEGRKVISGKKVVLKTDLLFTNG